MISVRPRIWLPKRRIIVLELTIRLAVAVDQCVLLIRRNLPKLMIAMLVIAFADSPELWSIAWTSALVILTLTFLKVMVGHGDSLGHRSGAE
jgi:hypothetical protein